MQTKAYLSPDDLARAGELADALARQYLPATVEPGSTTAGVITMLRDLADQYAGLLDALKVCGIQPPEQEDWPWTRITEAGPVEAGETAVDAARAVMDDCTATDAARERAEVALAALRPEVRRFAEAMEVQLKAHDRVRGTSWRTQERRWLVGRLDHEMKEFREVLRFRPYTVERAAAIRREAADAGNFLMFIVETEEADARPSTRP